MSAPARPPEGGAPSPGEDVAQRQEGRPISAPARPVHVLGAGPVGMALALALARAGRPVRVSDPAAADAHRHDRRTLALSADHPGWLDALGAWPAATATAITWVHVSQAGHFGRTLIRSADVGLPALGFTLPYPSLVDALRGALATAGVDVRFAAPPELPRADEWTIHAEGGAHTPIRRDYGHTAVVADVVADEPPAGRAWERFTPDGPLALLPVAGGYASICIGPHAQAEAWCALSDAAYLDLISTRLGGRLKLRRVGPRGAFPLALRVRPTTVAGHEVWIGNAAQTLHPVAGQGLNLGLRDARDLAAALKAGDAALDEYRRRRQTDRRQTVAWTDLLARGFLGRLAALGALRGAALQAVDLCPPMRRWLAHRLIYGPRG